MTDKPRPNRSEAAEAVRQARLEREAAALRANLQRRKAQARAAGPRDDDKADQPGESHPALPPKPTRA